MLGSEKFGAGPTVVVLKQEGPWTFGTLANHIWDVAGTGDRAPVNATYLQPFMSFIFPTQTTLTLNTESTCDRGAGQWTVPINFVVSQLFELGNQPLQAFVGERYFAAAPDNGPKWGVRFGLTLLFPRQPSSLIAVSTRPLCPAHPP